tara:strand:+ start:233 stop:2314 length:2082 start_codon:yes stop_codon:yes gene_type:complete
MIEQNISRLLLISLIVLIITTLCGSLIRDFPLIYNYQSLPIKDYTITAFVIGGLIFIINHFYFQKLVIPNKGINIVIIWSIFFLFLLFLINFADLEIFYKWAPFRFQIYKSASTHLFALAITLFIFYFQFFYKNKNFISSKYSFILIMIISFYLSSFLIINEFHRYNQNALNFQVFINPIVQVYLGKSSFIHFYAQYGHYGEFIGLILKPFNLSIFKITIVFSFLFFVSLICNGYFLSKIVKNKSLILVGFVFYVYLHLFVSSIWPAELYYQYFPLRIIFPSLTILFSYLYFIKPSSTKLYLLYLILSLGFYWNIDVGLVCFLSFLFTNLIVSFYKNLNKRNFLKPIFKEICTAFIIFISTSLFIYIYIGLIYGNFPTLDFLMPAQKSFLRDVTKLQISGLWILIIFIYIFSLFYSLNEFKEKQRPIDKMIFLLSILGIGLFSYHANQHYAQVLASISYPSFFLIIIFLDKLFLVIRIKKKDNNIKKNNVAFLNTLSGISILIVYFISFIFVSFFVNLNNNLIKNHVKIYDFYTGKKNDILWEIEGENGDKSSNYIKIKDLEKNIIPRWVNLYNKIQNFINLNYKINEQIVIFSMWDSYLHMKLQIPQSLRIINSWHAHVADEYDYIVNKINDKKIEWVFFDNDFFLTKGNINGWLKIKKSLDENYKIIDIIKVDKTWWNGWKKTELIIYKNK